MPPKVKLCPTPDQPSVYNIVKNNRRRRRKSSQCQTPPTNPEFNTITDQDKKKRTPPTPPIRDEDREVKRNKAEMDVEQKTQEEQEEEDFLGELDPGNEEIGFTNKKELKTRTKTPEERYH